MKRKIIHTIIAIVLVLGCISPNESFAVNDEQFEVEVPTFEVTFDYLYSQYCNNLTKEEASYICGRNSEKADCSHDNNSSNEIMYYWLISNKEGSVQTVGYTVNAQTKRINYIIRDIVCIHKHGELIQLTTIYTPDGQYLGNLKQDLSNDKATSSNRSPYFISSNDDISLE